MNAPSAQFDRALAMWREIDFLLVQPDDPRPAPFLDALRCQYRNGRVVHRTFAMPAHADFEAPWACVAESAGSSFFQDVAWDCTWLVIDGARRRIEVVLATDTD